MIAQKRIGGKLRKRGGGVFGVTGGSNVTFGFVHASLRSLLRLRCANIRFRNNPAEVDLLGFIRCNKVLRYYFDWRYI